MTLDELLTTLARKGVKLWAEGDQLRIRAPKGAVTAEDQQHLKARKEEILALVREKSAAGHASAPALAPVSRSGSLPLSFAQERLWFLAHMNPASAVYNLPNVYRLRGPLDVEAFRASIASITARHEALRTSFRTVDGRLEQVIEPDCSPTVQVVDLQHLPPDKRESEARRLAHADAAAAFDLSRGPLLRVTLLDLGDNERWLLLTLHHSVSDGWSSMVFLRDLCAFYESETGHGHAELPNLPVHYADYASWERTWLQGDRLEAQLEYWRDQLAGELPVLELPAARQRPAVASYHGATRSFEIPGEVLDRLKGLGQQHGATLFMTLVAAFGVLLHRYSGQADIIIGSPVAHRTHRETQDVIGCFINTLALRTDLAGDPSFATLLGRVRDTCLNALAHQDVPFEKLVEALQPQRDLSHSPIFQAMLILHVQDTRKITSLGEVSLSPIEVHTPTSKFDLTLELTEVANGLRGWLEYSTDLFDAEQMARLGRHFHHLLTEVTAAPARPISRLSILSPEERHQILVEWNASEAEYPTDRCLAQLFEAQAAATPDRPAVTCDTQSLTYRELNARANRLARYLQDQGVGRSVMVGLYLERSVDLLVALVGITKAGGTYVPLDPIYPTDRISYILADSGTRLVLSDSRLARAVPSADLTIVALDAEAPTLAAYPADNLEPVATPTDLAYVIYTSGSTGKPKGVMIEHRALVNFLTSMARRPGLGSEDTLLAVTTISFDIAALELYLPLARGGHVVIATADEASDARALSARIDASGATMMQATPATWRMLLDAGWSGRSTLRALCGGEALPRELAAQLVGRVDSVWNMYGPTETTIWSAVEHVTLDDGPISIGRPIANTQLYVLDEHRQPVPPGVTGELYIGGDGLARGYWERPDLTEERFVEAPFPEALRPRLYRTGDYARHLPDGRLECLGRTDHQVKIRGFRIELGEIESVLALHPGVQEAVVMPQRRAGGDARLVAYVINDPHEEPTVSELRRFARRSLPEYMVPSAFMPVESFPLTPNGKVDRQRLAATDAPDAPRHHAFVPPDTPMEQLVARVWEDVLGMKGVGLHDNFFDLGGHSLLSMKVILRLEQETGRSINPREIFLQTLQQLAASLTPAESLEVR